MMNEKLKTIRNEQNMYQREVAELLGITKQAYHLKETGKSLFNQLEMKQLARVFNCTLNDLF